MRSQDAGGIPATWDEFLSNYAEVVFRVVRLFADTYDERMDLFLFICDHLSADDMRRIRSFRFRPEAPCRFSTWLAVVARNLALDALRSREGRFRPFRSVDALDEPDRLLFEYHTRDGRPLEEARGLLRDRHAIHLTSREAEKRVARVEGMLSPGQRWRLLSRLAHRRRPLSIDPIADVAVTYARAGDGDPVTIPLTGNAGDPETPMRNDQAARLFDEAFHAIPERQRLAMTLRYRDGLSSREVGLTMKLDSGEADRLAREGLRLIRERLGTMKVDHADLESAGLVSLWPS